LCFSAVGGQGRLVTIPRGPLIRVEGQSVSIRCNVSDYEGPLEQDFEWKLVQGSVSYDLVSTMDPQFTDTSFLDRVTSGDLSLTRLSDSSAELRIGTVRTTDGGTYVCSTPSTDVSVSGNYDADVELKVIKDSLQVAPVPSPALVPEGGPLELRCNVTRVMTENTYLSVTWSVGRGTSPSKDILTVGPDGDVEVGEFYTQRYSDGGLLLKLRGGGAFGLLLTEAFPSDRGEYSCTAREWVPEGGGVWQSILEKRSGPVQVQVTMTEPNFTVTLSDLVTPRFSGDPAELACRVTGAPLLQDGRLGVTWLHGTGSDPVRTARPVAALDERGELVVWDDYRPRVESGLISLSRVKSLTFRLRFLHMWESDQGAFLCAVSTWTRSRDGGWVRSQEVRSNNLTVHWEVKKPRLGVVAYRLREASSAGATFEMSCRVIAENLQEPSYSVHVQMEQSVRSKTRRIVSLGPDLVVQPEDGGDQERRDSAVLEKSGPAEFRFRLYGVQVSDRGFYSCAVTAWTRDASRNWTKAVSSESNKVQIAFVHTGPTFNISIHADTTSIYPGETTKMDCILAVSGSTPNAGDIFYEVQWYQNHFRVDGGAALLASMDRWGVVKKSPRNSSSDCSLERVSSQVFRLSIHNTQDTDAGEYRCRAAPWMRSSAGTWTRGQDLSSTTVFLTVRFALWDSMKMPLLYGAGAALIVGLFSLLVGFACAHCWCRKVALVPRRSRNHLMVQDME
uniref:Ig-like domain-containing protein n=1 Tax=Scleropages formosus TaxID=113540 RepID=A0A8C9QWT7_SCLFO